MTGRSKHGDGPSSNGRAFDPIRRPLKEMRQERDENKNIEAIAAKAREKQGAAMPDLLHEKRRLEDQGMSATQIINQPHFRKLFTKAEFNALLHKVSK